MNLDIGAKKPIDGDQVFLVGRCFSSAEPPFLLLYNTNQRRRSKRNIQGISPAQIVSTLGTELFTEVQYPNWGTVWFRVAKVRAIRDLSENELATSQSKFGSLVLFEHDPEPEDEHAGFFLFGIDKKHASQLLCAAVEEKAQ